MARRGNIAVVRPHNDAARCHASPPPDHCRAIRVDPGLINPYSGKLGVVQEGALADLLLVDGNPRDEFVTMDTDQPCTGDHTPLVNSTRRTRMDSRSPGWPCAKEWLTRAASSLPAA